MCDVWTIFSRGRKPSCTACLATENEPVIAACEAMIVARVASTTIGTSRPQLGTSWKNGLKFGFIAAAGLARIQRRLAEVGEHHSR